MIQSERSRQEAVRLRIPTFIIGAVQNPDEPMSVFAQDDIETETAVGSQHLLPIPFTDGGDLVREDHSALEQVQAAEELDTARFEISLGQVGQLEIKPP